MKTKQMKQNGSVELCLDLLEKELVVLEQLALSQDTVRKAVVSREWVNFDEKIAELNKLGASFDALESERAKLFMHFLPSNEKKDEDMGFYSLLTRLPPDKRGVFADRFRHLKLLTLRIRLANESLMRYIEEAKTTVAEFLEAAFPDRKGRVYTRSGLTAPADMRSMVLNRSL
jgi:hypothetical protein